MIGYAVLGVVLVALTVLAARWFVSSNPANVARSLRIAAIVAGGLLAIVLVVSGRLPLASLILGGLLPLLIRWRAISRAMRNARGHAPGQQSEVSTRYLRMRLDHDTGVMSGVVLDGAFRGRNVHELSPEELQALLRECRVDDVEGATLLETYLDRTDPDWRAADSDGPQQSHPRASTAMDRDEAYRVLGLEPGAGVEEIKRAHRELMQRFHPDRGGSSYLAAKINEAKDLLLRG